MVPRNIERLANALEEMPRTELDLEAAKTLREIGKVFELAREMVMATNAQVRQACYSQMEDLIRGKRDV